MVTTSFWHGVRCEDSYFFLCAAVLFFTVLKLLSQLGAQSEDSSLFSPWPWCCLISLLFLSFYLSPTCPPNEPWMYGRKGSNLRCTWQKMKFIYYWCTLFISLILSCIAWTWRKLWLHLIKWQWKLFVTVSAVFPLGSFGHFKMIHCWLDSFIAAFGFLNQAKLFNILRACCSSSQKVLKPCTFRKKCAVLFPVGLKAVKLPLFFPLSF